MIEASEYTTGVITQLNCLRCLHKWFPVRPATPKHCPKCKSPYWNRPRRNHDVNKLPGSEIHDVNILDPEIRQVSCSRCGHAWKTLLERPRQCPKCHSSYWDKSKKESVNAPAVIHDVNKEE
jgi:predicted Zn-ribbon and HTH transcriptional regulator